jgi:VanZ family protein
MLFGLAFALSDEYHQSFVLGRTAKLMDVGFDSIGMFLAYLRLKQ